MHSGNTYGRKRQVNNFDLKRSSIGGNLAARVHGCQEESYQLGEILAIADVLFPYQDRSS
jgi:hypothetical protein